jgi:D-alanyl-D-alanine endopeptidase (penicillin-binding protein 7)
MIVRAASAYPKIREFSTTRSMEVLVGGRMTQFRNTNGLVASPQWEIGLSKTGFIREAGRCLVMQAKLAGRAVIIVLLDSWGRYSRMADANRIRSWMEAAAGIRPSPRATVKSAVKKTRTHQVASRTRARQS